MSINIQNLIKGQNYSNQDICETFLCAPQGGMRRSKRTNTLVLIANHTKSIYNDIWRDGILNYTGMGQSGDQTLEGNQNITLYESDTNHVSVHLFEVFKKKIYTYKGQVKLANKPYQETQDDLEGWDRSVWIFPLKEIDCVSKIKPIINESDESINLALPFILSSEPRKIAIQNLAKVGIDDGSLTYQAFIKILPNDLLKNAYLQHIIRALDDLDINVIDKKNLFKNISNHSSSVSLMEKYSILVIDKSDMDNSSQSDASILDTIINNLGWSTRTTNSLNASGIFKIRDLIAFSEDEILRIPGFGRPSLNEIQQTLTELKEEMTKHPTKSSPFQAIKKRAFDDLDSIYLDQSILDTLVKDVGWSVRTTNSLTASGILKIRDLIALSDYEILRIPSLGKLCLNEIQQTLTELKEEMTKHPTKSSPFQAIKKRAFDDIDLSPLNDVLEVPISSFPFKLKTFNCLQRANIVTLGALVNLTMDELIQIPRLGKTTLEDIKKNLLNLCKSNHSLDSLSYVLDDSSLENYIISMEGHFKVSDFIVFKGRIGFDAKPFTLEEMGDLRGVTRERIRQIQSRIFKNLIFTDLIKLIDRKLLSVRQNQFIPLYVNEIANYDIWFECLKNKPWILKILLESFESSKHNVEIIDGEYLVTFGANTQVANLIKYLERFIDEQKNTITKKDLKDHIKLLLPVMANELTNYLFQKIGANFTTHADEEKSYIVNRGKGISQKILTIIESSDKPITSEALYQDMQHSEQSKRGTLNHLTKMSSTSFGVYLFNRSTYGIRRHLLLDDDEIDLIIEKINLHTIDENIDKQFHCSEILKQVSFFPSHKKYLTKYTLAICLRLTETFNYLGNFMFVRAGSKNTKIVKKDYSEMVLDVLEKSSIPLSSQEIKKIISNDRHVPSSPQIHKKGRLIPIRNFPENNKTSTWGLIDVHLKISKQQLEKIICAMESLIKRYDYKLTPEEGIKAIKGNTVLEEFQDKILVLFVLVDKNINFIEKNNTLFHVNGKIDNLSQEDCLKITASKISEDGMKKQDIFEKTQSLYGNDVAYNILSKLTQYGFTFNKNSETWHKGELVEY